jgi:hypothetical protein
MPQWGSQYLSVHGQYTVRRGHEHTTPLILVGPHAFRVIDARTGGEVLALEYRLYHANGVRGVPREGHPNAHRWARSRHVWPVGQGRWVRCTARPKPTPVTSSARRRRIRHDR